MTWERHDEGRHRILDRWFSMRSDRACGEENDVDAYIKLTGSVCAQCSCMSLVDSEAAATTTINRTHPECVALYGVALCVRVSHLFRLLLVPRRPIESRKTISWRLQRAIVIRSFAVYYVTRWFARNRFSLPIRDKQIWSMNRWPNIPPFSALAMHLNSF